jgi:hypothetical protein
MTAELLRVGAGLVVDRLLFGTLGTIVHKRWGTGAS